MYSTPRASFPREMQVDGLVVVHRPPVQLPQPHSGRHESDEQESPLNRAEAKRRQTGFEAQRATARTRQFECAGNHETVYTWLPWAGLAGSASARRPNHPGQERSSGCAPRRQSSRARMVRVSKPPGGGAPRAAPPRKPPSRVAPEPPRPPDRRCANPPADPPRRTRTARWTRFARSC